MIRVVVIPAVCWALIPIPLVVITALVNGFSLNYRRIKLRKMNKLPLQQQILCKMKMVRLLVHLFYILFDMTNVQ